MFFPALKTIAADLTCQGAPLAVYMWLVTHLLDVQGYTPVKSAGVAVAMRMAPRTVRRALELLEAEGYLDAREGAGGVREYRLMFTRADTDSRARDLRRVH